MDQENLVGSIGKIMGDMEGGKRKGLIELATQELPEGLGFGWDMLNAALRIADRFANRELMSRRLLTFAAGGADQVALSAVVHIQKDDINSAANPRSILENAYVDLYEQLYANEDRILLRHMRDNMLAENHLRETGGNYSGKLHMQLRECVSRYQMHMHSIGASTSVYTSIIASKEMIGYFDPNTRDEALMRGELGTLLGSNVLSDAFRHPQHRIFNDGDVWAFANPMELGQYFVGPTTAYVIEREHHLEWHAWKPFALNKMNKFGWALLETKAK